VRLTYHALPEQVWRDHPLGALYAPDSLQSDGFIHTTEGEAALARVLSAYYRHDPRPYAALVIDLDRVQAPWEVGRVAELDANVPHIHGPLNPEAIVDVVPLQRTEDGAFIPPAARPSGTGGL
jgi:uncharacterized protein (DUF952 family)